MHTEHFDCVVGADGVNSQVRDLVFDESSLEDLDVTNWRFLIEQDTKGLEPIYYLGSDSFFMRYPMPDDRVYCYAHVVDENKTYADKADKDWLLNQFKDFEPKGSLRNKLT
jgi:2-polyprenyl-6-methoxyphenol hydroxylase-like FAD-dependent oxidoreductase